MKGKKILVLFVAILLIVGLAACGGTTKKNGGGNNTSTTKKPKILADLTNYSTDARYYNVPDTFSSYNDTTVQINLLTARQTKQSEKDFDDRSVPVKIFVESSADDIIARMGRAGLSRQKMVDTVAYLAGNEDDTINLETIVASGEWNKGEGWSFFDDWDYLDMLEDEAEGDNTKPEAVRNRNDDNVQRQRRKIMGKVFAIGMTGDEFARFVVQELLYAQSVATDMHNKYGGTLSFDEYTKSNLDHDTLVYFKAFNDFDANGINLSQINQDFYAAGNNRRISIQLYGYYYDYNKKSYDTLSEAEFEKQLMYGHMETFTDTEYLDYLALQRKSYEGAYRYDFKFYETFYRPHFDFQGRIESYERSVYEIDPAIPTDTSLTYSGEMRQAMTTGFAQQLVLTDCLFEYSQYDDAMRAYNRANTNFVNAKNGGALQTQKDDYEWALNMEKMKAVDYIMTNMTASQLTAVLRYQIRAYSADMVSNIQTEQKNNVLEALELDNLDPAIPNDQEDIDEINETIGRNQAMIAQIRLSYGTANITSQMNTANSTNWKGMHDEVKEVLSHDYSTYKDGTARLNAFEDLVIKKKTIVDDTQDPEGATGVNTREEYDTNHNISRFLSNHEDVLRYAIGQVLVEVAARPAYSSSQSPYKIETNGTFTVGVKGNITKEMLAGVTYGETFDEISFEKSQTFTDGAFDAGESGFLTGAKTAVEISSTIDINLISGQKYRQTYTFAGWFIDTELKYQFREDEEVKYNLVLYPGYNVISNPVTYDN